MSRWVHAFYVQVRPGASRTRIRSRAAPDTLKVEVAAEARQDRANRELERFLRKMLGIGPDDLRVAPSSRRSRKKSIQVREEILDTVLGWMEAQP